MQIAYNSLFSGHPYGETLISPEMLKRVNFAKILSFYNNAFVPEQSLLFIKGNVNTYEIIEQVQRGLRSHKRRPTRQIKPQPLFVENSQQVFLFDTEVTGSPKIFWFEVIPPISHESHFSHLIINNILFGFPTGVLFRKAPYFLRIDSEIVNHQQVSIICNKIRVNRKDVERFILLAESEKKKLSVRMIGRNERLNALNYLYGKFKVDTEKFDFDLQSLISRTIFRLPEDNIHISPTHFKKMFSLVSLGSLNEIVRNPGRNYREDRIIAGRVIVITGNASEILQYLKFIKPRLVAFRK
jgi:hypothetical protein